MSGNAPTGGTIEELQARVEALEQLIEVQESTTIEYAQRLDLAYREAEAERARLAVYNAAARVLGGAENPASLLPGVLEAICTELGFDAGTIWRPAAGAPVLELAGAWHRPEVDGEEFLRTSAEIRFARGNGVPGRVWESCEPLWVADVQQDANFPRAPEAARAGLRGALAFPVIAGGECIAVMDFYSTSTAEPAAELLATLGAVGAHIGQFLQRTRVEAALRDSEHQYRQLIETAVDAVVVMEQEGTIVQANPAVERLLGHPPEQLVGQPMSLLIPERFHEAHRVGVARYLATGIRNIPWSGVELPGLHRNGREVPMEVSFAEFARNGTRFFTGTMRDITERSRAEAAMRDSEQRYRSLSRALAQIVWTTTADGSVEDIPEWRAYTGQTPEQTRGWGWLEAVHPDDQEPAAAAWKRAVETRGAEPYDVEYRVRGSDDIFRWFSARGVPVLDGGGTIREWVGVCIDIDPQKRSEAALREREEEFRTLANSIPQLAWMADESGAIFWYNRRWYDYTGTAPEDMQGWGWQSVHHPDEIPRVLERWKASLESGDPFDMVFPLRGADGIFRPFLTRVLPVRDTRGRITRWFGTNTDISEQRESEAREKFLGEASALLASSLNYEATLREVAHLAVPTLADWCAVDVVEEDGEIRRVAVAHPDPAQEAIAHELERRYPPAADAPSGVPQVVRTGEPELVPDIPAELLDQGAVDAEHLRLLRELDLRSYLIVPLTARGRRLGALTLVHAESGRRFSPADLGYATALAQRAAVAVDNARLFAEAREARRQTEAILESITDAFFALDREWRFTYVNSEAARVLGHAGPDLIGRSTWDVFPDARHSVFWTEYHRALREQVAVRFESATPDGRVWYDYHVYPSAGGLSIYFRDVSREKAAELAVRASEERYRFLADAIPQQVWTAGADGQLDYVNRVVTEYFRRSAEAVIGDGWQAVVHPEDLPRVVENWVASLESGDPYAVEFRLRDAEGLYRWHIGRAVALRDAHGSIDHWFGTNTDIDEQKQAEAERERLLASAAAERTRLRELIANAPAVMALYHGPDHVITMTNPTWERTVGKPNALGRPFRDVFPEFEGTGLFELLDEVYATGEAFADPEVAVPLERWATGEIEDTVWSLVWQPLKNTGGEAEDILVHAVEVTDQVRARRVMEDKAAELEALAAALAASNRELDQFAYVASHDLKAPLRGIANLSQWIEEDLGEVPDEVRNHLELMRGRVHRMEGLIDGILEFSRAGRVHDEPDRVPVEKLLHEIIELLAPPPEAEIRIEGEMPILTTERVPLQQVLMNLIGNALKYTRRPDPRVVIRTRQIDGVHEFSVSDNGPGISSEYRDRVFAIFQTLQARDEVEGTGIGLSLVKKQVESRGGRVWIETSDEGGAAFFFTWPESRPAVFVAADRST